MFDGVDPTRDAVNRSEDSARQRAARGAIARPSLRQIRLLVRQPCSAANTFGRARRSTTRGVTWNSRHVHDDQPRVGYRARPGVVWVPVRYQRGAVALLALAVGATALLLLWRARSPSSTTVSTLKDQVPGLVMADMNLLDLPADPAAQRQALDADRQGALREAVLRVWDRGAADDRLRDVEANRQLMVADRTDVYDEVRASIVSWDDISGSALNAHVRVTVTAAVRRAATGLWDAPKRTQWQFGLHRQTDSTWKLTDERVTAYLSGQG